MPKEINVNVSSLVDLKAELFRKQQQKKQLDGSASGQASKQLFVKGSKKDVLLVTKAEGSKKAQEANDRNGRIRQLEEELRREEEVQRKMKESLANKALLYDRLANGAAVAYGDGEEIEFMVNFDKKARETRRAREEEGDEVEERGGRPSSPLRTPADDDDDDQWIEYTDSFGRERRCPRNQLAKYIEADLRLARADVAPDRPSTSFTAGSFSDASRRFAEHDDYSQIPVGPVHHANVADNEPREFGVSHFKFDPDEERRRQQMEALEQLRNKTVDLRSKNEELKKKREKLMASRLEKVRKRKNLAPDPELNKTLGLDEDDETPVDAIPLPGETEAKSSRIEQSAPASTEYPSPPKQSSVRPWDRGKNTFSQEKWVDKRRDERDNDFAPPSSYFTR